MEKITDIELTSIVTKSSSFLNEATSTILQVCCFVVMKSVHVLSTIFQQELIAPEQALLTRVNYSGAAYSAESTEV